MFLRCNEHGGNAQDRWALPPSNASICGYQRRIGGIAADHRCQNLCPGRQGASPRLLAQSLGHRRASSFLLGIWVYTGIPEA